MLASSQDGDDESMRIFSDAKIHSGLFDGAQSARMVIDADKKTLVAVLRGSVDANGHRLDQGDAALIDGEGELKLDEGKRAEVLVFELGLLPR